MFLEFTLLQNLGCEFRGNAELKNGGGNRLDLNILGLTSIVADNV